MSLVYKKKILPIRNFFFYLKILKIGKKRKKRDR